jgi:hypothetical protein
MVYPRGRLAPPPRLDSLELLGSGRQGMWWERGDGLVLRLCAPDEDRGIERSRLSLVGLLVACLASGSAPRP